MYNTGISEFLAAASNPNRDIDTRVRIVSPSGTNTLDTDSIASYKIIYASTAGKFFTPGNFVATTLQLSLASASPEVSKIDFKTLVINSLSVDAGIKAASQVVYVPMGVFFIDPDGVSVEDGGYVNIKASDMPPALSEQFDSHNLQLPCTIQAALSKISELMGLPIVFTDDFPNLSLMVTETFELVSTYRDAIKYFAETLGAYACMDRQGCVSLNKICRGTANLGCSLDDNYLFSVNQQESTVKPFQHISIRAKESDVGASMEVVGVDTDKEYSIINNPLTYGHPEDFLEGLVSPTSFSAFHPAKIVFHGRPDIDTGDVIEYTYKGEKYGLPVCIHTFEYSGGFKTTIEAIGTDSLTVSSTRNSTQTAADITALRQSLNSLVRDLTETQSQLVDINGNITNMSTLLQIAEQLQATVSRMEGDYQQVTELTQAANQLKIDIQTVAQSVADASAAVNQNQATLLTYFNFQADGLTIGLNTSNIKLHLSNDRVQFLKDGYEVAYLSEGQLYVTDAHFIKSLVLGNFELAPRANGNLSLRRR